MISQPESRKHEQPGAPKWRRILGSEEVFVDSYKVSSQHMVGGCGRRYGYWCSAGVLLNGHETCTCYRAQSVHYVHLFCEHPPDYEFPLHYQVMMKMIDHVGDGTLFGFNDYSIGALVRRPTYALYGFLLQTNIGGMPPTTTTGN